MALGCIFVGRNNLLMKTAVSTESNTSFSGVISDFKALTKFRLAASVVLSAIAGYLLGAYEVEASAILLLTFGGFCMVGASNAFNQVIEKDTDAIMKRTANRPIPAGRMSVSTAMTIAITMTVLGIAALYVLSPKTAFFGSLSIFLYCCVYTPLKSKTPLAVFVGAFPGAIPFMLGWVAATNDFGIEPGTLFMIQFFWQFPHFWALGWILDDEYKKAGFKMLPTGKKDAGTAVQIIMYTFWMIVISVIPVFGITGRLYLSIPAAVLVFLLGMVMLAFGFQLYRKRDNNTAKRLMIASIAYISLVQLIYVLDKFI